MIVGHVDGNPPEVQPSFDGVVARLADARVGGVVDRVHTRPECRRQDRKNGNRYGGDGEDADHLPV